MKSSLKFARINRGRLLRAPKWVKPTDFHDFWSCLKANQKYLFLTIILKIIYGIARPGQLNLHLE